MPTIDITLRDISVHFDMDEEQAKQITKDDLLEMAQNALGVHQTGKGVQVVIRGVGQFHSEDQSANNAVFANVFIEGPFDEEIEIDSCDDEFETLLDEDPDICG